jgi:NADH-quinone oxidoreductase subunit C
MSEQSDLPSTPEPERLHGALVSWSYGQQVLHVTPADYMAVIKALADDGYHLAADLCAVDYLEHMGRALPRGIPPERFEIVVNMADIERGRRIRVRVQVSETDGLVPSLFDLFPGTEAMEREVFDMFGIAFSGHPDLTRILMPEDWIGHPLRKDYAIGRIPVQFKGANS